MQTIIVVYQETIGSAGMKVAVPVEIAKDLGLRAWQSISKEMLLKIQERRRQARGK